MQFLKVAALTMGLAGGLFALAQARQSQRAGADSKPSAAIPVADKILRQPTLSPDGKTLAFVFDGDIWSSPSDGGDARRLTITEDNDGAPVFSPDGKSLAFRSRRYGSDDIFVMPARGGDAKRLTFADSAEDPCCWLPDSSGVIFACYGRDNGRDLWIAPIDASEPWPITGGGFGENESQASVSPDGKFIAYARRGSDPMRRRGYLGTADGEIWVCEFDGRSTKGHRPLTANGSHDAWPCFADSDTVLFATSAAGKGKSSRLGRLTAVNLKGEEVKGWGGENELDPREIAVGGGKLAFATGSGGGWRLHVGELGKRPPQKLNTPDIRIETDRRSGELQSSRLSSVSEYKLSPDGKKLAFVAGGDVFVMPAEEGGTPRQETDTTYREKDIDWSPDSKTLAYTTTQDARCWVVIHDVTKNKDAVPAGPFSFSSASRPRFLPGSGELWCAADEGKLTPFLSAGPVSVEGYFHGANLGSGDLFDISPDGQWLLYEQPNEIYDDSLWVANVKTGEKRQITHQFGGCSHATFSRDGKRVTFIGDQEGDYDVYVIDLVQKPIEFKEDKLDKLLRDPAKKEEPKKDEPGETTKDDGKTEEPKKDEPKTPGPKKAPETRVDFAGLDKRTRRVSSLDGNELWPVSIDEGKTFYFIANVQAQSNIWKLALDPEKGPDLKQLTQSKSAKSDLRVSADEKSLWYLDAGTVTSFNLAASKTTSYGISVEQRRNRRDLRAAAFKEAAWVMGSYFYDEKHHGQDWKQLCERYEQALNSTSTGDEFGAIMNELLGELNSSHQGFTAADERSDGFSETTGCLGVRFDALALSRGEYVIVEILKGGPLDVPNGPAPGIKLIGINGKVLGKGSNLARELTNTSGKRVTLSLNDKFILDGARELAVKPISRAAEAQLFYERWEEWQRSLVHKLSEGKLGYVHIEGMDDPSLRHFKHHLGDDAQGRQGIVIDVRFNGGGYTAVDVLEILIKRPWLIRRQRAFTNVSENAYRSVTLEKPSVLMINQDSFSNAEILAEGYRRLGIGRIIGVDTAGGVIGTGGFRLIDGSSMRLPGTGAYTVDGENLENNGRKPDLFVENHPEELDQGIDRQTEAAVKALLEQIAKGK